MNLIKRIRQAAIAFAGLFSTSFGKTLEKIDPDKLSLDFGNNIIIKNGKVSKKYDEKKINNYMKNKIIRINLDLRLGSYNKIVWSSDLTKKYITINADYRS